MIIGLVWKCNVVRFIFKAHLAIESSLAVLRMYLGSFNIPNLDSFKLMERVSNGNCKIYESIGIFTVSYPID
jgi:hypothetical protein